VPQERCGCGVPCVGEYDLLNGSTVLPASQTRLLAVEELRGVFPVGVIKQSVEVRVDSDTPSEAVQFFEERQTGSEERPAGTGRHRILTCVTGSISLFFKIFQSLVLTDTCICDVIEV